MTPDAKAFQELPKKLGVVACVPFGQSLTILQQKRKLQDAVPFATKYPTLGIWHEDASQSQELGYAIDLSRFGGPEELYRLARVWKQKAVFLLERDANGDYYATIEDSDGNREELGRVSWSFSEPEGVQGYTQFLLQDDTVLYCYC